MFKRYFFSLLLFCFYSSSVFAQAPSTGWLRDFNHLPVKVNLQLTGQAVQDNKVNALLNVTLDGDWKTYWRSPGEGGVAPTFDWASHSTNIKSIDWHWPAPKRYPVYGVETVGYKGEIHFPIQLTIADKSILTQLKGTLTLASCTTICVLTDYNIDISFVPDSLIIDEDVAFAYAQAVSNVPISISQLAVETQKNNANITHVISAWDQMKQQVVVQITHLLDWQTPDVFVDIDDQKFENVFFSKPVIDISDKQLTATFDVSSWSGAVNLNNANINITAVDKGVAVEIAFPLTNQVITSSADSLISIFFIALLGGLILNIMPCVLPVLGMKLTSVLSADGTQRSTIRKQFIASSLGIVSSFWLLALFLFLLKTSGEALGWGIQFQSPYFIALMVVVTALFTANMLGLFEIQLPASMQTWLAMKGGHSYIGHYLQGMFATLLATPCSAPFLGTAVGVALGASTWQLFAIFTALGLGMALPWLLIALFPNIALLLPKPGKWMNSIKLVFGLLILITCLWLVSLLSSFIGPVYSMLVMLIILIIFGWLIIKKHGKRIFVIVFSCLLLVFAIGFIAASLTAKYWAPPLNEEIVWVPLDARVITQEVSKGHVVFVDVTADWCVTCKANKIGVLLQDPVYSKLQETDIVTMKGDWTVRSDSVTAYLQSFGRYGVPFNIVYGPAAPNGIELSTILNSDDLLKAIQKAKGQ
jgi:suppressor for copper-sensitivity B